MMVPFSRKKNIIPVLLLFVICVAAFIVYRLIAVKTRENITGQAKENKSVKSGNLMTNGDFSQTDSGGFFPLINGSSEPASYWKKIESADKTNPVKFFLDKSGVKNRQKVVAGIGGGLSQPVKLPAMLKSGELSGLSLSFEIAVSEGQVLLTSGNRHLLFSNRLPKKYEIMVNPPAGSSILDISFTAKSKSNFWVSDVAIKRLIVSGKKLQDHPATNKLQTKEGTAKNKPSSLNLNSVVSVYALNQNEDDPGMVKQTIPVKIGISAQVIANHCDGSTQERTVSADPLDGISADQTTGENMICPLVKRLVLRDLISANNTFIGTGKRFSYPVFSSDSQKDTYPDLSKIKLDDNTSIPNTEKLFDIPWDQEVDQGCIVASGGQAMPLGFCNHNIEDTGNPEKLPDIYIALVSGAIANEYSISASDGEAYPDRLSLVYSAPAVLDSNDYWQMNNDANFYNGDNVLAHELGHIFGQIHTPYMMNDANNVLFGKDYMDDFYDCDLVGCIGRTINPLRQKWAYEIIKRSRIPITNENFVWNQVPKNIEIEFHKPDGSLFVSGQLSVYGTDIQKSWEGDRKVVQPSLINAGLVDSKATIPGQLLENGILFFVLQGGNKHQYYGWLHITDGNFAYWEGNIDQALIIRQMVEVNQIQGEVYLSEKNNNIEKFSISLADGKDNTFNVAKTIDQRNIYPTVYRGDYFSNISIYRYIFNNLSYENKYSLAVSSPFIGENHAGTQIKVFGCDGEDKMIYCIDGKSENNQCINNQVCVLKPSANINFHIGEISPYYLTGLITYDPVSINLNKVKIEAYDYRNNQLVTSFDINQGLGHYSSERSNTLKPFYIKNLEEDKLYKIVIKPITSDKAIESVVNILSCGNGEITDNNSACLVPASLDGSNKLDFYITGEWNFEVKVVTDFGADKPDDIVFKLSYRDEEDGRNKSDNRYANYDEKNKTYSYTFSDLDPAIKYTLNVYAVYYEYNNKNEQQYAVKKITVGDLTYCNGIRNPKNEAPCSLAPSAKARFYLNASSKKTSADEFQK